MVATPKRGNLKPPLGGSPYIQEKISIYNTVFWRVSGHYTRRTIRLVIIGVPLLRAYGDAISHYVIQTGRQGDNGAPAAIGPGTFIRSAPNLNFTDSTRKKQWAHFVHRSSFFELSIAPYREVLILES